MAGASRRSLAERRRRGAACAMPRRPASSPMPMPRRRSSPSFSPAFASTTTSLRASRWLARGRGADALARVSQGVRRAAAQGGVRYAAGDGAHAQARAPAVVVRAGAAPGSRDCIAGAFAKVAKAQGDLLRAEAVDAARTSPCRSDERKRNRASPERAGRARRTSRSSASSAPSRGRRAPRATSPEAYVDLARRRRRRRDARARQGSGHDGAGAIAETGPGRGARGVGERDGRRARRARRRGTKRPSKVQRGGGEAEAAKREARAGRFGVARARAGRSDRARARRFPRRRAQPSDSMVELGRALDAFVATMTEDEMRDEAAHAERQLRAAGGDAGARAP